MWFVPDLAGIAEEAKKIHSLETAILQAKKYLEEFKGTQLNIAITGKSGAGKSTFLNAFMGMKNGDVGAAQTGVVETTREPEKFPHPHNPKVILWDLPGIGTTKFPADKYLEHVKFKTYDFFIIIAADRFTENDAMLAQEIEKMGKKFYFVRSKIDNNLRDEKRDRRDYVEAETLQKIRENCITGLLAVKDPKVFLISSVYIKRYDFRALQETWQRDLPSMKKDVLILALPNIDSSFIADKKAVLSRLIPFFALLSSFLGIFVLPGLSYAVNHSLVRVVLQCFLNGFGLDVKSLQKVSMDTNMSLDDLKAGFKCPLSGKVVTDELVLEVLISSDKRSRIAMIVSTAVSWIPLIGNIIAGSLPTSATGSFYQEMLDSLCVDADMLLQKVMVRMADQEDFGDEEN